MHGLHAIHFLRCYRRLAGAGCLSLMSETPGPGQQLSYLFFKTQGDPATSRVAIAISCGKAFSSLNFLFAFCQLHSPSTNSGGDDGTRTRGIRLAKAALSQLSYIPVLAGLLIFPVRVL